MVGPDHLMQSPGQRFPWGSEEKCLAVQSLALPLGAAKSELRQVSGPRGTSAEASVKGKDGSFAGQSWRIKNENRNLEHNPRSHAKF